MNISPRSAEVSENMLHVTWPDNHKSVYDLDWLKRHSYDPKLPSKSVIAARKKILWDKNISSREDYPRVLYQDVMRGNVGLAKWLELIDKFGFCEVQGVPVNTTDTEKLARRISFIRESHYGGFWASFHGILSNF
jgi:trimethyllysine dioxygenase